ncbi:KLHL18 [Symbiodinium necroappetens]|uniref:KLHL18 protein n=1 Tax=Symbiodinium necroappetens TaxID=1628268 RepID=A0A812KNA6_9DINO|nr:KLHL18 [Symbiodinium necroappetens]
MKLARVLVPVAASLVFQLDAVVLEGKNKESLPDPNEVSLPSVPNVVDAGKAGFPELPAVSTMLSDAAQTLTGISTQAQRLQTQMMQVQQENAARMQRQKAVFDRKLKEQEQKNLEVVKENALIAKNIMDTKKVNEDLLHHAQSMQKGNALRHSELKMLQDQLAAAQKFLTESVEQTDDTKATDLDVLAEDRSDLRRRFAKGPVLAGAFFDLQYGNRSVDLLPEQQRAGEFDHYAGQWHQGGDLGQNVTREVEEWCGRSWRAGVKESAHSELYFQVVDSKHDTFVALQPFLDRRHNSWAERDFRPSVHNTAVCCRTGGSTTHAGEVLQQLYPCKIVVANDILEERSWIVELWDPASHSWLMTLPVPLAVTATAWSASDECAFLLGYTSDDEQPEESSHASRSSLHDLKRKCHSRAVVVSCIVARLVVFAALQDLCMAAQALRFNAYGTNKFQEVLPAPSVWRTRPAMALVDGNVYVCGGLLACGSATDAFESFSFPAGVWKSQAPLPSGPRKFATAVVAENLLVLLCGQDEDSEVQADCWDTKAQLWRRLPAMDPGRVGAAVVLVGGRIMVCGGISDGCYLASVALLNLGQGLTEASGGVPVWQTLPSMHGPRADCAVAVSGGCVYVCGGEEGAGPALASVERLDCKRMVAWESLPAMAVVRAGAAAVVAAGHLLVFGGYSHEPLRHNLHGIYAHFETTYF